VYSSFLGLSRSDVTVGAREAAAGGGTISVALSGGIEPTPSPRLEGELLMTAVRWGTPVSPVSSAWLLSTWGAPEDCAGST
jgi:hypothetical protein